MGDKNGQDERAKRNDDHADDGRRDLAEELLDVHERETGQNGWEHLRLVADHFNLGESEIPYRNFRGAGDRVGVEQLRRNERDS